MLIALCRSLKIHTFLQRKRSNLRMRIACKTMPVGGGLYGFIKHLDRYKNFDEDTQTAFLFTGNTQFLFANEISFWN